MEEHAEPGDKQQRLMPVWDHIGELRKRLIAVLIMLVVGLVIGIAVAQPIYEYMIAQEPVNGMPLHAFSLWDPIGIYMKFAFIVALVLALPFAFYQLWAFVKPGLGASERRATLRYIPFALFLFLGGLSFSYFVVFPLAYGFTTAIGERLGLVETYGVVHYFTFMFNIVIPVSLLFELPLLLMFLTKLRIVNPVRLRKMRRVAYFLMVFIAVLITPPDFISDILVAIPLILLYEFSVLLSGWVYKRQLAHDRALEAELDGNE